MNLIELIKQPWPWYVAGPLVGLTVPVLLLIGNKTFGISSSLRHVCAACLPANIPFFSYDWKKEIWNLFFVAGILLGGMIAAFLLANPNPVIVNPALVAVAIRYCNLLFYDWWYHHGKFHFTLHSILLNKNLCKIQNLN